MIEIPESHNLTVQLNKTLQGKTVASVCAAASPHKFAWYSGDPSDYGALLEHRVVVEAQSCAGYVLLLLDGQTLLFTDGVVLRYLEPGVPRPSKHQLLLEFTDDSALAASIQMYGGLWLIEGVDFDNPYYRHARKTPSPLSEAFTYEYFRSLGTAGISKKSSSSLSVKAYLATEQRIPGLGNGCLQDILWKARIHPKRKIQTLGDSEWKLLYETVRSTLREMVDQHGRDTELDLYGKPGAYKTILSKNTVLLPCERCGSSIVKEAYMGGSVYYCPKCQT